MGEEAVPVVLAPLGVEGPVGLLGVDEDDPGVGVARCRRRSTRTSRPSGWCGPGGTRWNHGCWSEVWFMTRSAMTRRPRLWACSTSSTASARSPYSGRMVQKSLMS